MFIDYLPPSMRFRVAKLAYLLGLRTEAIDTYLTLWNPERHEQVRQEIAENKPLVTFAQRAAAERDKR
jgi:hypothetical protein